MKNKIFSLLAATAVVLGATSCHDDINNGLTTTTEGSVNLRSMGVEINNAEKVIVSSRASVDLTDFIVDIVDGEGASAASWTYGKMPELFSLPVGDYTAKVKSHEVKKAAWEEPYFVGEKTFSIKENEITPIGVVTCSLANVKVTISYTDELRAVMGDDCKVVVKVNDEGSLTFTPDETRAGYFEYLENSPTLVAEFTGTVEGNAESLIYTCKDLAAGQHRKIKFTLKGNDAEVPDEAGSINVIGGINISTTTVVEDLSKNVVVTEDDLGNSDRPGQEEPEVDPDDNTGGDNTGGEDNEGGTVASPITFTCATVDFDKENSLPETAVVYIHADNGLSHLVVTISSTNAGFASAVDDLGLTNFDLAYPANNDQQESIQSLGLPYGNQVIDQNDVTFDISQFMSMLKAFSGTHKFQLSATDNNNQQLVKTLTFVVP
jgi:hypothetical protein